jgi:hypothetical protein
LLAPSSVAALPAKFMTNLTVLLIFLFTASRISHLSPAH